MRPEHVAVEGREAALSLVRALKGCGLDRIQQRSLPESSNKNQARKQPGRDLDPICFHGKSPRKQDGSSDASDQ
jgi:hypothetical protein